MKKKKNNLPVVPTTTTPFHAFRAAGVLKPDAYMVANHCRVLGEHASTQKPEALAVEFEVA